MLVRTSSGLGALVIVWMLTVVPNASAQNTRPSYSPIECQTHAENYADRNARRGGTLGSAARGSVRGAIIGGILGGNRRSARRGARAGAMGGLIAGAARSSDERRRLYNHAYEQCLAGILL